MADFNWTLVRPMRKPDRYIIAYGSNLDIDRMGSRCPDFETAGTSVIRGYRMLFKKSMTGYYATIEQDANCCVSVVIYRVTVEDEAMLDRYEGCPRFYYKREFRLPITRLNGKRMKDQKTCVAYIMHEYRELGEPSAEYFSLIDGGYRDWGFDTNILDKALADSAGNKRAEKLLKAYRREKR